MQKKWILPYFSLSLAALCLLSNCRQETIVPEINFELSIEKIGKFPREVNECSGFFFEQEQLFIINDGGSDPVLHQTSLNQVNQTEIIMLPDVINFDWEAITSTDNEIIIGDFGNNFGNRTILQLLHFDKENYSLNQTVPFLYPQQTFQLSNTHNFDCEAFIIKDDRYHLFTKNRGNKQTNLYTASLGSSDFALLDSIEVPVLITDAYYFQPKGMVLLLGNQLSAGGFQSYISILQFKDDSTLEVLQHLPLAINEQVEAITLKSENVFLVGSEKENTTGTGGNLYEVTIEGL